MTFYMNLIYYFYKTRLFNVQKLEFIIYINNFYVYCQAEANVMF